MRVSFFVCSWVAIGLSAMVVCALIPDLIARPHGIKLSTTSLDFGQVDYFDEPTRSLVITNPQRVPVSVQLEADCTCVGLSRAGRILQAAESMEVIVTLRRTGAGELRGILRQVDRTIDVHYSNQGTKQTLPVTLTAQFVEPLVIDPHACVAKVFPFAAEELSIGMSGNVPIQGVLVHNHPAFCSDVRVSWNEKLNAGQLVAQFEPLRSAQDCSGRLQLQVNYALGETINTEVVGIPILVGFLNPVVCEPPIVVSHAGSVGQSRVHFSLDQSCLSCKGLSDLRVVSCPRDMASQVFADSAPTLLIEHLAMDRNIDLQSELRVEIMVESHDGDLLNVGKSIPVVRLE